MTPFAWWIKQETKHGDWKTWTQASRRKSRSWRYKNVSLDLRDVSINPYVVIFFLICRMRRTSCVMRNRSWRLRKRESSSNSKQPLTRHSLVSYQTRQHSLKLKLLEASLCLTQLTPALPCGSSCLLLLLIPHRTMSFVLRLLRKAALFVHFFFFLI